MLGGEEPDEFQQGQVQGYAIVKNRKYNCPVMEKAVTEFGSNTASSPFTLF